MCESGTALVGKRVLVLCIKCLLIHRRVIPLFTHRVMDRA